MARQWIIWRPVLAGISTLKEVEEEWTMLDVMRANLALDVQQAAEAGK